MFGWYQDRDPNTSRKGTLSADWKEAMRVSIESITISPGGWREGGDRLRQSIEFPYCWTMNKSQCDMNG